MSSGPHAQLSWRPPTPGDTLDEARSLAAVERGLFAIEGKAPRVGRYFLHERLGQGGMGVVYVGYDPELDRRVAIKFLLDRDGSERLLEEARALAHLEHPNVVTVYEVGESGSGSFLAMALVEGETLDRWAAGQADWRTVVNGFAQAADGLAAVHAAGLTHRDIKPGNLLVDRTGRVRIADFGLAIRTDPAVAAGRGGTTGYMAPEQRSGTSVGPQADQFSLSLSLLDCLLGKRPTDLAPSALPRWREAAAERWPRNPVGLRRVLESIARALQPDPDARHSSVAVLANQWRRAAGSSRRGRWTAAAAAMAAVAGLGMGWILQPDPVTVPAADETCARAGASVDAVWTPVRRAALEDRPSNAAFAWGTAATAVDTYVASTRAARIETCNAAMAGQRSAEWIDARGRCLDRIETTLARLLDAVATDPELPAVRVHAAVANLHDPRSCGVQVARRGPAKTADEQSELDALAVRVDDLQLRFTLGLPIPDSAPTELERALDGIDDHSLRARGFRVLSHLVEGVAQKDRVLAIALRDALAGQDSTEQVAILVEHGKVDEWLRQDLERALKSFELADGALAALRETAEEEPALESSARRAEGMLALARGNVQRRRGDFEAHLREQQTAVSALSEVDPAVPIRRAKALNNLGEALRLLGRYDEADAAFARAVAGMASRLGEDHWLTLLVRANRMGARHEAGEWANAAAGLEAIAAVGSAHAPGATGSARISLAIIAGDQGRWRDASELCADALVDARPEALRHNPVQGPFARLLCATFDRARDRSSVSDAELASLHAAVEATTLDPSMRGLLELRLAEGWLAEENADGAAPHVEAAKRAFAKAEGAPIDRARALIREADVARLRGDADRARTTYALARQAFDRAGVGDHPHSADAWIGEASVTDDPAARGRLLQGATTRVETHALGQVRRDRIASLRAQTAHDALTER